MNLMRKIMSISERLQQIVEYVGITANAFAVKIGVSQPRFRNYLNGRTPDYETLRQICITFVIINERWLLTGEGKMLKNTTNGQTSESTKAYESNPRDIELIAANKETIETQKELIISLKDRIKDLEAGIGKKTTLSHTVHSVESLGGIHQDK